MGSVSIVYSGAPLHSIKGAALLAPQGFTHSYGQNQRYVPLNLTQLSDTTAVVNVPPVPEVLPGQYLLFLVSRELVPSKAQSVYVIPSTSILMSILMTGVTSVQFDNSLVRDEFKASVAAGILYSSEIGYYYLTNKDVVIQSSKDEGQLSVQFAVIIRTQDWAGNSTKSELTRALSAYMIDGTDKGFLSVLTRRILVLG